MVDNDDKNQDLQHSWFFAKLRANHIEAKHQGFLRRGKSFPGGAGKVSSDRWSRVESFVAEAASHIFLLQQGATRQQDNKEQEGARRQR